MTSYEKVDFVPTIKKFDYIKKGKSFSDSINEVKSFE